MRRKALQFLGKIEENNKETYGFKSQICPQSVDELNKFEKNLMSIIKFIDFRNVHKKFQEKLQHHITDLRHSNKVIVPADKTSSLNKIENTNRNKLTKLNLDAKKIAYKLLISDRVDWLQKNEAYITVKNHNEYFQNSPTFRLINPTKIAKINIGKISKIKLDKINKKLTSSIQVNQ